MILRHRPGTQSATSKNKYTYNGTTDTRLEHEQQEGDRDIRSAQPIRLVFAGSYQFTATIYFAINACARDSHELATAKYSRNSETMSI